MNDALVCYLLGLAVGGIVVWSLMSEGGVLAPSSCRPTEPIDQVETWLEHPAVQEGGRRLNALEGRLEHLERADRDRVIAKATKVKGR